MLPTHEASFYGKWSSTTFYRICSKLASVDQPFTNTATVEVLPEIGFASFAYVALQLQE